MVAYRGNSKAKGIGKCIQRHCNNGYTIISRTKIRLSRRFGFRGTQPPGGWGFTVASKRVASRCAVTDRKSTRLNSSHLGISYAVFCLKKKKNTTQTTQGQPHTLPPTLVQAAYHAH